MTEPAPARRGVRATLLRWRAPLVLVPLLVAIVYGGAVGAQMLWAEPTSTPAPEPVVTCWDGSEEVATDCPAPTGPAGLRWVFPSFRPGDQRCSKVVYEDKGASGPLEYSCRTRVEGTTARVRYSERSSLQGGLTYFDKRFDDDPQPVAAGTRLLYRDTAPRRDGTYEATLAYVNLPYAVTVNAVNERLRDRVLDDVRLRPERYLRVRPGPAPAE